MCGLKHSIRPARHQFPGHTLRGCVDWNRNGIVRFVKGLRVTPCVGVWIETTIGTSFHNSPRSHPAWVCGLKHNREQIIPLNRRHTLRGCVDWNKRLLSRRNFRILSHPAWVCGLKRKTSRSPILLYGSHPAWVCGLKLKTYCTIFYYLSHTLRGCVDWNSYEKEIR